MIGELLNQLDGPWRENLARAGLDPRAPLAGLKIGQADDHQDRPRFIVFGAGDRRPAVALKVARGLGDQQQLSHEFQVLQDLWSIAALNGAIPQPIGLFVLAENLVMVTSALPGAPLEVLVRRRERTRWAQLQEDLFRAQVWVQLLQSATVAEPMIFAGRSAVEQRQGDLTAAGARDALPRSFLDRLSAEAEEIRGQHLPLGGRHGDFQPSNFLLEASRIGVVDWEQYSVAALGCGDIFQFAIGLARAYLWTGWHRPTTREAFSFAFLQTGSFATLVAEVVDRFLLAMGMPQDSGHLFLALFLMDMASGQAQRGSIRASTGRASMWLKTLVTYGEQASSSVLYPARPHAAYPLAEPRPGSPMPAPLAPTTIDLSAAKKRRRWIS